MLAGLTAQSDESPVPAWFANSSSAVINPSPTAQPRSAPAPLFVGPREFIESQWIVRLNSNLVSQVGSLGDIDRLLSTTEVEVHTERGLGMTGLVQLRTISANVNLAETLFSTHAGIVDYSRNIQFVGNLQPNDADFGNQTHLESNGQFGTLVDADLDATRAWDTTTGSSKVVVGIIDSGIDLAHPDLYLNVWINQGEIGIEKRAQLHDTDNDGLITFYDLNNAGNANFVTDLNRNGYIDARDLLSDPRWTDGIDTDRNGFVDDFFGWNFREALDEPFEPNDPSDASGHGTHVSGIIGASGNNAIGVAGINWRTSLMPLKFLDQNNQGDVASAIAAVNYATMMRNDFKTNVRVLNNSWGQAGSFNAALSDALTSAQAADILIVAAAGNGNALGVGVDNDRTPFYPASYPLQNLLSVAASDGQDRLAAFSNYGATSVDLVAPGVGIRSTLPGGRYGEANGTSMAAPMVSGTAALIWSALPQASASEVREALLASVDRNNSLQFSNATGGRLNTANALAANVFAPTAVLVRADNVTVAGGSRHEIIVRYQDRNGLDVSTLGDNDIQVVHAWGEHETLTVQLKAAALQVNAAGTEAVATYELVPPGGSWDVFDFGNYQIDLVSESIGTRDGRRANRAEILGQFRVQIDAPDVLYVDSYQDDNQATTLRAAIEMANQHPKRNFTLFLNDGTYQLTRPFVADSNFAFDVTGVPSTCSSGPLTWSNNQAGDLDVLGNVTILGDSHRATTIESLTGDRALKVHPQGSLTLKRVSVVGGSAPSGQSGGAILSAGNLQLTQVELRSNSARGSGSTSGRGGAIAAWAGNASISQTRLSENEADIGGGILACGNAQLTIAQSTIDNNQGGGIVSYSTAAGTIDNSTIANNFGGAIVANARDYPGGNGSSTSPRISLDGSKISFLSDATNLVAADNNAARDAYLFNRSQQTMQMLSVADNGQAARSSVDGLVLSGDGQHAAFLTQANNLVSGDNLLTNDVFLRDLDDATTSLVSSGSTSRASRGTPALSDDGRFVAYQQIIVGDPFNTWAVYVRDRQLGTTQRLSLSFGNSVAKIGFLDQTSISGDGRFVVLSARASGTADGFFHEIYLIDRINQTIAALPARPVNALVNGSLYSAAINGNGRYIAFVSDDTGLVTGDTNGVSDVFVYDTIAGTTRRVSQTAAGTQANRDSQSPAISSDGRFIAFSSLASNLSAGDQNGLADVFVVEQNTLAIERASVSDTGLDANGSSTAPSLSGDGRFIVYESSATNIVPVHANHQRNAGESRRQVYLRDRVSAKNESVSAFELPETLSVTSSTLVNNSGSNTLAGNVTLHNSLLAGNLVGFDLGPRTASAGYNIYASISPEARLQSSDIANNTTAQKLGPLTEVDNLPPAYPLLQGNPAIDAGASQAVGTFDQWNQLRVQPDIGAVEAMHGSLGGRAFADLNGNRQRDAGEPGLSGEQIFVDTNNDGIRQPGERSLSTLLDNANSTGDQTGQYNFEHLAAGPVVVRSIVSDQWLATPLPTTRITSGSVQGNGASSSAIVSSTANTIAFLSLANNFVANDDANPSIFVFSRVTNSIEKLPVDGANLQVLDIAGTQDQFVLLRNDTGVYVWDRNLRSLTAVSVSSSGQLGNAHSDHAAMSNDGRWIVFSSFANNLVAGDTDAFADVFLVDRQSGTIRSITKQSIGIQGNNDSEMPGISADGQVITFVSDANNLVVGDTNLLGDIFVYQSATEQLRRVNLSSSGAQSNGFTYPPQISGNGRYVVFQSLASNLVSDDPIGTSDLFVVDLQTNAMERLDIPWQLNAPTLAVNPSISFDGQYVTFEAASSQLNHPDATTQKNVFVYDRYWNSTTGTPRLKLVSRDPGNATANGDSRTSMVSQDGQWIAFQSTANNFVTGDTNAVSDIFIATNPFEDASRRMNLQIGEAASDVDFALQPRPGSISGTLFNDISQDSVYDVGDPTLASWTVFLDANANGRRDVGESFVVSDTNGNYRFGNVPTYREHVVAVELPNNWEQVVPDRVPGQPRLFLPAGADSSGRDFGFRLKATTGQSENARIEGRVFNDTNSNGSQDPGEPSLASIEVYLDLNGNERRDFGEPRTVTDAQGMYSFSGLGSRNYSVRMASSEGATVTSPLGNRFSAGDQSLASGSVTLSKPQDITIADLDGRNGPDLAVALYAGNSVVLQLNNGVGGFTTVPAISIAPAGLGPIAIASGKLNQLGNADVVLANSLNNTLTVLLDFNGSSFVQQRTINVGAMPIDVTMADLDNDGDNDLIAAVQTTTFAGQLRLFINDGTGQFSAGAVLGSGGKRAVAVTAADLNRDNIVDFVVANQGDFGRNSDIGNVAVLLGRNNGTYATPAVYIVGSTPLDVAVGDFNGDSMQDLASVNFALNTASILRGDGAGTFQIQSEQYSVGQGPVQIESLDIEGDRDMDLVVSNLTSRTVSILRNRQSPGGSPTIAFAPAESFGVAEFSVGARLGFAAADLDSTGSIDLALINSETNSLKVLNNSLVAGAHRLQLNGTGTSSGQDFGVRFETLVPKLDPIIGPGTIREDSGTLAISLTGIARGRSSGPPLQITATSSVASLLAAPTIQYVEGSATGQLILNPLVDAVGQTVVTVEVRDAGADQVLQTADDGVVVRTLSLSISPVNDAPSFRLNGNQVITIGSALRTVTGFASNFDSGGGPDEDAQSVADYLIHVDRPELFLVQPFIDIHGTLRYQPTLTATGMATVRVQVKDNGGTESGGIDRSLPASFQIAVIDLADGDIDFGDAPITYPVTIRANGARHKLSPLFLGTAVDAESDGQSSADASGDDLQLDDEDGIQWILPPMASRTQPTQTSLNAKASAAGKIDAWIDFNQDGDWNDTGEQILTAASVVAGTNWLPFTVPVNSAVGLTYARVRLSSLGGLSYVGLAEDGEVEDYRVSIFDASLSGGNSVVAQAANLPPHEVKIQDGQFLLQSSSQILLSIPVSSLAEFRVVSLSGATIYAVATPATNLKGTIKTDDNLSNAALLVTNDVLDLGTLSSAAMVGITRVELVGSQAQHLEFVPTDLNKLNTTRELELVVGDGDTIDGHAPWELDSRELVAGRLVHRFSYSNQHLIARAMADWYNPLIPFDVNGNGVVTALDALLIINYINQSVGPIRLPQFNPELPLAHAFYDVSGSNSIEPLDVLLVINVLNAQVGLRSKGANLGTNS